MVPTTNIASYIAESDESGLFPELNCNNTGHLESCLGDSSGIEPCWSPNDQIPCLVEDKDSEAEVDNDNDCNDILGIVPCFEVEDLDSPQILLPDFNESKLTFIVRCLDMFLLH